MLVFAFIGGRSLYAQQMDPYCTAVSTPVPKGSSMLMLLPDYQLAHTGPDYLTYMGMAEYGITSRWTAGFMAEGQKIGGLPATFGGVRFNTYFKLLPHDHLLHLTAPLGEDLAVLEGDQCAEVVLDRAQRLADQAHGLAPFRGGNGPAPRGRFRLPPPLPAFFLL